MSVDALIPKKFGLTKFLTKNQKFGFFMANLEIERAKSSSRRNKTRSQVISDPKKLPFFAKLAIKNPNFQFWVKILVCPNFLGVRASTDVKSDQKFQVEHGQILIGRWVEPDKSRCISNTHVA